jgi:Methyltransferase FkbM domain
MRQAIGRVARLTRRHPKQLVPQNVFLNHLKNLLPRKTNHELIRLGPNGDGGYLVPNDFKGISLCLSPGTGKAVGFENSLLEFGIPSVLIDEDVVNAPSTLPQGSTFINNFVTGFDSAKRISLNTLIEKFSKSGDLILQMDIEGHEYKALSSISRKNLDRCRIIVCEFHYTFEWIFKHEWDWYYSEIFDKLLENHVVVHTHPNNAGGFFSYAGVKYPNLIEITFLRKDRIKDLGSFIYENHVLDQDDNHDLPTMHKYGLGIK